MMFARLQLTARQATRPSLGRSRLREEPDRTRHAPTVSRSTIVSVPDQKRHWPHDTHAGPVEAITSLLPASEPHPALLKAALAETALLSVNP